MKNVSIINDMPSVKKLALSMALEEERVAEESRSKSKANKVNETNYSESDLRNMYYTANDLNIHVYEKLLEKNYIKRPMDDYEIAEINS